MTSKKDISNLSYEEYMKDQLEILSKNFTVKTYKRADNEVWHEFKRNIDLRIQIQWKGKSIYEFLVEKSFWYQRNTNKEDRIYMRRWADTKIHMLKSGIIKSSRKKPTPKLSTSAICSTQDAFEKMKQV
jgi:hypothetical protein